MNSSATVWVLALLCSFGMDTSAQTRPAAAEPSSITIPPIMPLAGAVYAGADRCRGRGRGEPDRNVRQFEAGIGQSSFCAAAISDLVFSLRAA